MVEIFDFANMTDEQKNEQLEMAQESSIKQSENFIEAMYIEGIVKKCFEELSVSFLDRMKNYVDEAVRNKNFSFDDKFLFDDNCLIRKMDSEINFLRDEIKNKNKIVEILLSDRNHTHFSYAQESQKQTDKSAKILENNFEFPKRETVAQKSYSHNLHENQFISPKKTAKISKTIDNGINCSNRFSPLQRDLFDGFAARWFILNQ